MPLQLREVLESLSSYHHQYPPNHPRSASNRVNHMHLQASIAGERWHILSRIQDAGLDHTRRSNFFAHHIALSGSPPAASSPAWLLRRSGVLKSSWDGTIAELSRCSAIPIETEGPRTCEAWVAATGESGWAAIVANRASTSREPIYIIFGEEHDVLALIEEVSAQLPHGDRWKLTFSTYCVALPHNVECSLRCVLKGSAEEVAARSGRGFVIDLAHPGPLPSMGSRAVVGASLGAVGAGGLSHRRPDVRERREAYAAPPRSTSTPSPSGAIAAERSGTNVAGPLWAACGFFSAVLFCAPLAWWLLARAESSNEALAVTIGQLEEKKAVVQDLGEQIKRIQEQNNALSVELTAQREVATRLKDEIRQYDVNRKAVDKSWDRLKADVDALEMKRKEEREAAERSLKEEKAQRLAALEGFREEQDRRKKAEQELTDAIAKHSEEQKELKERTRKETLEKCNDRLKQLNDYREFTPGKGDEIKFGSGPR